jgi:hypothetical protein
MARALAVWTGLSLLAVATLALMFLTFELPLLRVGVALLLCSLGTWTAGVLAGFLVRHLTPSPNRGDRRCEFIVFGIGTGFVWWVRVLAMSVASVPSSIAFDITPSTSVFGPWQLACFLVVAVFEVWLLTRLTAKSPARRAPARRRRWDPKR